MFINLKTGRPAWLLSQDQDGSVTYSHDADDGHHIGGQASDFFAAHREATADEAAAGKPARAPAQRKPAKASAAPKPAARKPSKGPRKPRKAKATAPNAAASDKPPGASPDAPGGERAGG